MWEAIKDGVFWIIQALYHCVGDWGMAIIVVTVIFRLIMTPLMYSQAKSSYEMQKINPKIMALREKYANDPVRMNEETQKLYAEAKFNPLAGCVPMLIQMPIFLALFQVLRSMDQYVGEGTYEFYGIVSNLTLSPSVAMEDGLGAAIPYVALLLIFAFATFVPMLLQGNTNPGQKNQMLLMAGIMSLMMLWIGWGSPAGVLLFWGASSVLAIIQSTASRSIIKKKDEQAQAAAEPEIAPVEINVTRKAKKKRQTKKR